MGARNVKPLLRNRPEVRAGRRAFESDYNALKGGSRSLRGSVDRNSRIGSIGGGVPVAPFAGAWIETCWQDLLHAYLFQLRLRRVERRAGLSRRAPVAAVEATAVERVPGRTIEASAASDRCREALLLSQALPCGCQCLARISHQHGNYDGGFCAGRSTAGRALS